jgi:phosphomethylpyrimidine synthase
MSEVKHRRADQTATGASGVDVVTDLSVGLDASVTTGPIEGSRKVYRELAEVPGARVPFRRVELSNGEQLDLYDTSGPIPTPTR